MPIRILVVEDEPAIADNISYALSTDGYEPVWRTTGEAALKDVANEGFALIILDVGLPDINGFELYKKLAEITSAPVIFLTARSHEVDRVVGLELGADDYISKPFSPRELTARVRTILRRVGKAQAAETPPSVLAPTAVSTRFPFKIDEERQTVSYFGATLDLSRYEYRLLKVFLTRPGRVFTREELLYQAWDQPESSYDRTIDAHIKMVRAKLKAIAPEVEAIVTHRGTGYSLKEDWS